MTDLIRAFIKLVIVLGTVAIVGFAIYKAAQLAFPATGSSAKLQLPSLDLSGCSQRGSGPDPADFAYAYQLQQYQDELSKPAGSDGREVTFTVQEGELPADVAVRLQRDGFVSNSDVFVLLLKCRHASETIQAGDHVLRHNMTMDEVIGSLQKGTARGIAITIRPGWRAEQVAEYLATVNLPQFNKDEFLSLVKTGKYDYPFLRNRPEGASQSLEGYLFPETYNVLQAITADQLINRLLFEFDNRVTPDLRDKAVEEKLTLHEAITLASIVEREAVLKEEAPIIASVYLNRIKAKTFLNADPTVQYAIGFDSKAKQWWPVVPLEAYSKVNSPYNTYTNTGLPPGPICEPSFDSIMAALQPAKTDFLYFLAKGDGSHVFAKTLEEQSANLAKYGYQPAPTPKP